MVASSGMPPAGPGHEHRPEWAFTTRLWRWRDGSWHFVTVPEDVSDEVDALVGDATGGFGSVRVDVVIGGSRWSTSLFPSAEAAAYVLPVKKSVRAAEGLAEGDETTVAIRLAAR